MSLRAEEDHVDDVEEFLESHDRLAHLRARRRANAIIIESGPKQDPAAYVRFRRVSIHRWSLDIADHRGHWESTPYTGELESLLNQLLSDFPWVLEPRD